MRRISLAAEGHTMIADDSPFFNPPEALSREQVIHLDGLRYAAEMTALAYERLSQNLLSLPAGVHATFRETAAAMLDAWSIVDSVNRFRDILRGVPGLSQKQPWIRLLLDGTAEVDALRNSVQHQLGEIRKVAAEGGQLWGYLSWAEVREGQHTGIWRMAAAGSDFVGDRWLFAGPWKLPYAVPLGHVRLNAFGRRVYLGRLVDAVREACHRLETELRDKSLVPRPGTSSAGRGVDAAATATFEFIRAND
jgi:hypothetical protein